MNTTNTIFSDKKIKLAGNTVTFYQFGREFRVAGDKLSASSDLENAFLRREVLTQEEIREKSLRRAVRTVKDLVSCNVNKSRVNTDKFLTLTQADFERDITVSNAHFHRFMVRLNRYVGRSPRKSIKSEAEHADQSSRVEYTAVPEFQKNGTVHYHVALYAVPYIPQAKIARMWGRGYVWVNKVRNSQDVGAYLTKYMVKDIHDARLQGEKCYMTSNGLERPLVSTFVEVVNWARAYVTGFVKPLFVSGEVTVPYLKTVQVEKYSLWRYPKEVRYLKRALATYSLT